MIAREVSREWGILGARAKVYVFIDRRGSSGAPLMALPGSILPSF